MFFIVWNEGLSAGFSYNPGSIFQGGMFGTPLAATMMFLAWGIGTLGISYLAYKKGQRQ